MLKVERDTEILIDNQLKNLGWNNDPTSKDRNVYLQRTKNEKDKSKLKGIRPDYVLYQTGTDRPLAIIEAKKVGQNIHEAIKQGLNYAEKLDCKVVFATDGVFTKTIHKDIKKPLKLNNEEIDELVRESLCLKFLDTNEVSTLDKKVVKSRNELIQIFKTANNYLRSEGLKSGDERFTEFSNILFLKLISEMEDIKDEIHDKHNISIIDKEFRWNYFKNKRGKELVSYVNDSVLKQFQGKYNDRDIFQSLSLQNPKTLEKIIDELDTLQLTDINADIKGDAFEHFLKSYNASDKDLGEYFTPRHIVKTLVKLLDPRLGETIYDPFCGTGGMLIESFQHIKQAMPMSTNALKILKENTIYGNEITSTARITKMNMILIGDGHSNIHRRDSLANPIDDAFDVCITNMPFSQPTEYQDLYDIPMTGAKNGDSICIQHCIRATKKGGRIGVIVPEGFLFDKKYQKTREFILNKTELQSVISLPQGCFLPYTGVKTDIMLLKNVKQGNKQSYYWYFDVKNDGYSLNNHREKLDGDNDLEVILAERKLEQAKQDYLLKIGIQQIEIEKVKNDYFNFVGSRHINNIEYNSKYELKKFEDVVELLRGPFGSSIKKEVCVKSGFKVYEQGNVIKNDFSIGEYYIDKQRFETLKKFEIQENDVLLTCAGTLGRVAIVPKEIEKGIINSVLMRLRIKNNTLLPQYFKSLLESDIMQNELLNQSLGTSIKNMRAGKEIKQLLIPVPSIEEQKRIVKELEETQVQIKEYKRKIKELESHKQQNTNSLFSK